MNQKQSFLPESLYSIDSEMTLEKISILYQTQMPIVGTVVRLDSEKGRFEVHLGSGIKAYMSFNESTIYPIFRKEGNISPSLYSLTGKKIRANILSIGSDIYLSRKKNMENTLNMLVEMKVDKIPYAEITGFSRMSAFFDIGEGLLGRSYGKHFAQTIYNDIHDIEISENTLVSVKILSYNPETKQFNLSRVALLPDVSEVINEGDFVTCKVFTQLDDIGYYVLINNEFKGIMDSETEQLNYGDIVIARVRKIGSRGPHLKFIDFV